MITVDVEQGSEAWFAVRCGIPTASCFDKLVTSKGEPSKQAEKYLFQLAGERVTGKPEEGFKNDFMQRGNDREQEARNFYTVVTDSPIQKVGVCFPDEKRKYACSPDGLVGSDGGIEIKCPSMAVHVGYLLAGKMPVEYFQQVQGSLLVTGRKWWDFVSYYPGIKPVIIRIHRDESFLKALTIELEVFSKNLEEITLKIR
jgi:hypothetical protein